VAKLGLKPGQKVLDVGCGTGGGDIYMAENFDVEVVGIDLSINMISLAIERVIGLKCSVEFECADCTKKSYPENTFDVIYSRDTLLHIKVRNILWFFNFSLVKSTPFCVFSSFHVFNFYFLQIFVDLFRINHHYLDPFTNG